VNARAFPLYACGVLLFCAANCFAQAQSGTGVGTVTDPEGAVAPVATVVLINDGTHLSRSARTNTSGQYVAANFPTGLSIRCHNAEEVPLCEV
jgi:hypothetical protein